MAAADVPRGASAGGGTGSQERVAFSAVTSKRVLYLLHAPGGRGSGGGAAAPAAAAAPPPLELSFLEQYGDIARHLWFGEGLVMVGFRSGRVVVVSPHRWGGRLEGSGGSRQQVLGSRPRAQAPTTCMPWNKHRRSRDISTEVHSGQHLDMLAAMAHCPSLGRVAIGGGGSVKACARVHFGCLLRLHVCMCVANLAGAAALCGLEAHSAFQTLGRFWRRARA